MGSYSQSLPTSSNSILPSNEGFITLPQSQLGGLGENVCRLTAELSEAVQTNRIDRVLFAQWGQAVAQYREEAERMICGLEESIFSLPHATSNTDPFPMTQEGATQGMAASHDTTLRAYFAARGSAELSPGPNPASYPDAQEIEPEPEYNDPVPPVLPGNGQSTGDGDVVRTAQFTGTVTLQLATGGSYSTRVRGEDPVRGQLIPTWSNDLTIKPAWKEMPHMDFYMCVEEHKPTYVRFMPEEQEDKDNLDKISKLLRKNRLYASGSWGIPADNQPKENIIVVPFNDHLLVVAFPATGIPDSVISKLVQERPMIPRPPRGLRPPPTHDVEARQNQQGAPSRIQEQRPPAQQHEQNFPPTMHCVEPRQYVASIGGYPNSWTNSSVAQPNHVIPSMSRYAAGEGSDPNRPRPSQSHLSGGPSAGMNMNWDGSQGELNNELNNVRYYADRDMPYSEAAYRNNHGYSQ